MVGTGHFLAFCLLVFLPFAGCVVAQRHGSFGLLGFGAGVAAFVAVMSGNFLRLLVLDFFERKTHPNRIGVGRGVATVAVFVFVASVAACVTFYRHLAYD